tara:strand:- start:936 stop:1256 length:321 start_codon:yes stop_codon:yes gene_type:complete
MPYIERYEGGGRVLLSNGVRMYHRNFLEYMAEQFPPAEKVKAELTDDEYDYMDEIAQDVKRLSSKLNRLEKSVYLKRAERDTASGRLRSEEPEQKRKSIDTERGEW